MDLVAKAGILDPERVIDIGCGPGNSTAVLVQRFPGAKVLGVDSSPDMIEQAKQKCPGATFQLFDAGGDLSPLGTGYDLVFSNACIQWIPSHHRLVPGLLGLLSPRGVLAVQLPMNGQSPLFKAIDRIAADPRWGFQRAALEPNETLKPEEYFGILSKAASSFSLWETVYYHRMKSHDDLVNWVKGTRLRPYLSALNDDGKADFFAELTKQAEADYPVQPNGEILFPFHRFFFTATKQ